MRGECAEQSRVRLAIWTSMASFAATLCVLHLSSLTPSQALWTASTSSASQSTAIRTASSTTSATSMHHGASYPRAATSRRAQGPAQADLLSAPVLPASSPLPLIGVAGVLAAIASVMAYLRMQLKPEPQWTALLAAGQRQSLQPLQAGEWNPDMGTSLGDLFGSMFGDSSEPKSKTEEPKEDEVYYKDIEISSKAGVDYSLLKELLKEQKWELADNEHRRLLIELAGPSAEAREYVWPTELAKVPVEDMTMLDKLWRNYSGGKFGFSVQRKIWAGHRGNWEDFFKQINWVTGENNDYRKWPKGFLWTLEAEKGHLPLTNALRGTGLLQAVFEHPAFGGPLKDKQVRK